MLKLGDKIKVEGKEGYIALDTAAVAVNGEYKDVPGFTCLSRGLCIKSSYTEADRAEDLEYKDAPDFKNGDAVGVEGKECKVLFNGHNVSDFAILTLG